MDNMFDDDLEPYSNDDLNKDLADFLEEPVDEDWVTKDYILWYRHGCSRGNRFNCVVTTPDNWPQVLKAKMDEEKFWPNCWYQGERGEWNLLDVKNGCFWDERPEKKKQRTGFCWYDEDGTSNYI